MANPLTDEEIRENFSRIFLTLNGDGTIKGDGGIVGVVQRIAIDVARLVEIKDAPGKLIWSTISHVITAVVTALVLASVIMPARGTPAHPKPEAQHAR